MTGMERNSEVVWMGAYAPLFVHTNNRPWPTNMVRCCRGAGAV